MRRLLLGIVAVPAVCYLMFVLSCEKDDYRDTLPLRTYDGAVQEAGMQPDLWRPPPDLTTTSPDGGVDGSTVD